MSTRSNIAILLREEDRNRDFETPMGTTVNAGGKKYLYVYCHNDGYPSGVGQDLKDMFDGADYEDALEYILMGDRSTTNLSYWQWRSETNVDPVPADTEEACFNEEYLYIIEEVEGGGGRVKVRQYGEEPAPTNDDVREMTEDWYNENITEEDVEDYKSGNYELGDMIYDCLYNIDFDAEETQEGDDIRDVISETLESLLERDREMSED